MQALHYKKYSTESDVWSYGAVLYEIWSIGHKPFEQNTNREVHYTHLLLSAIRVIHSTLFLLQCIKLVDSGYRLPPPPGCTREIYEIMIQCWY